MGVALGAPGLSQGSRKRGGRAGEGRGEHTTNLSVRTCPPLLFGIWEDSMRCGSLKADRPGSKSSFWH